MLTSQRLHETGYVDLPVESGPKPGFCMTDCSLTDLFFFFLHFFLLDIFTISRDRNRNRNQNTNTGRKIKTQYSYHIYLFNQNQRMKMIQIVYAPLAKLLSKVDCRF